MPENAPENRLRRALDPLTGPGVALAFSGGCDSALLLFMLARMRRERDFPLAPVFFHGPFQTAAERIRGQMLAEALGLELTVLVPRVLEIPEVRNNTRRRCYFCKRLMFDGLASWAARRHLGSLVDGTNADDTREYRPGRVALAETGVHSPLAAAGLTKAEVRELAEQLQVPTAREPSAACLATRFPYDTELRETALRRAENAEAYLRENGFADFRVRCHGDLARIELRGEEAISRLLRHKTEIDRRLAAIGFRHVTLDLREFRSGSFDL